MAPNAASNPSPVRRTKLAQQLAERLLQLIHRRALEVGDPLGNEAALAVQFGAGRWSVREALQILERDGHIRVQRGRQGGIFVASPSIDAISSAIRSYLEFIRIDVADVLDARGILDEAILQRALERVTPDDVATLRDTPELESETEGIHAGFVQYDHLLATARSPVLQAFVRVVGQLGLSAILRSTLTDAELTGVMRAIRLQRREQIDAVIAGRFGDAMKAEGIVLEASRRLLLSAQPSLGANRTAARRRALGLLSRARRFKRPELLIHEITSDIVAQGWPVGEHLGTEAELLTRYAVSRSAFREALRSLEDIGVVEMRTGRHSGLKVGSPDPNVLIRNTRRQFARLRLPAATYLEALKTVGAAAAGHAAQRFASATVTSPSQSDPGQLLEFIANECGNRILSLLLRILTTDLESGAAAAPATAAIALLPAASIAVIDAIRQGDSALARRLFLASFDHAPAVAAAPRRTA